MTDNFDGDKISAAAMRSGNRVFSGPTHIAVMRKIIGLALPVHERCQILLDGEDGFVTDTGRFVSREEGFSIAKISGQIPGELGDPIKNIDFYGGPEPRLDSGIVSYFAPMKFRPSDLV